MSAAAGFLRALGAAVTREEAVAEAAGRARAALGEVLAGQKSLVLDVQFTGFTTPKGQPVGGVDPALLRAAGQLIVHHVSRIGFTGDASAEDLAAFFAAAARKPGELAGEGVVGALRAASPRGVYVSTSTGETYRPPAAEAEPRGDRGQGTGDSLPAPAQPEEAQAPAPQPAPAYNAFGFELAEGDGAELGAFEVVDEIAPELPAAHRPAATPVAGAGGASNDMFQFFRTADGGRLDEEAEQLPRLLREAHDVGRFDDVAQSCARAALRLIRTDLYPQAVGLIAALLDEMERADRTRILRESAEQALRRIGTAENVQHAAELLQHDAGARETLLHWLAFLGGEAVSQLEAVLFRAGDVELRRAVFRHLLPLEGVALRVVQRGLTDPSPARARIVLELASQPGIEPERALRWIAEGARHPDPVIRGEVARHAGAIGGRGAVRLLTGMLNDPDRGVRQASIQGLGSVGDPSAVPFLGRVLADTGDEELPLAAIESLGKIGSPEAVPILLAVLHRRSLLAPKKLYRQKAAAIEALGRIPTPSAREALQGIAAGKDADLAADARRALSFLE